MSNLKVDNVAESTAGAGVTIQGLKAPGFSATAKMYPDLATIQSQLAGSAADTLAGDKAAGRIRRFDGTNWRAEGVTYAAGPVVSILSQGGVGDGTTDDHAAIAAADTAAQAVGGLLFIDPGTFKCASSVTLASDIAPNSIGCLKPTGSTTVLAVNGAVLPGPRKLFDQTGGGAFSMANNSRTKEWYPEWFGADPTGVADSSGALVGMVHSLPDWSDVVFRNVAIFALQYTWMVTYRTGMTFRSSTLPSDGFTNTKNPRLKWTGVTGGVMVANYSNGSNKWIGLTFDMQNADIGLDTDELLFTTTVGTAAQTQAASTSPGTLGPAFLLSLPANVQIALQYGGPGTTVLTTTIAAVADNTHCTLAAAASGAFSNNGATFSWPGFAPPPTPVARIATNNVIETNLFLMTQARSTQVGHRISMTSKANVEYMVHRHNIFASYGGQRWCFNAPDGGTPLALGGAITKGSNVFGGFTNSPFTSGMNGQPVYIAEGGAYNAGAKGWNASLNGYAQFIDANTLHLFQDAGLTTPLNAAHAWPPAAWSSVTAYTQGDFSVGSDGFIYYCINNSTNNDPTSDFGNHWLKTPIGPYNNSAVYAAGDIVSSGGVLYMYTNTTAGLSGNAPPNTTYWQVLAPHFQLGTNYGTGTYIGASQNAKRHTFTENQYNGLHVAVNCQGGSMHHIFSNFTNCDINIIRGSAQSEPSSEYGSNSENARQHLQDGGGPQPWATEKSRLAMANVYPSVGFIAFVSGYSAPGSKFETIQFENYLPRTSQIFQGVGITVHGGARDITFANAFSLPEVGWDGGSLGGGSTWDFERCVCSLLGSVLPFKGRFVDSQGVFNGTPKVHERGTPFFSNQYTVQDSDFVTSPEWGWYSQSDGTGDGFKERLYARFRRSDGSQSMVFSLNPAGKFTLTDGASVAFEPTTGDYFVLSAGGSRTITNYSNWLNGHVFTVRIFNNTAGVIATTWQSLYKLAGAWVDPGPNKSRTIQFVMDGAFAYEIGRSAADI